MTCINCGGALLPGEVICRTCGAATPSPLPIQRGWPGWRLHVALAIIVPLVFFIGAGIFVVKLRNNKKSTQQRREQSLASRAFRLASTYPGVTDKLGAPVHEVCCASYEDGRDGTLTKVPVQGPLGKGTLIAFFVRDEVEEFRSFELELPNISKRIDLLPSHKPAQPEMLRGEGHVFLVPVGNQRFSLETLAAHYKSKFNLDVKILAAIPPPITAFDMKRKQWVAEELIDAIKKSNPSLVEDRRNVLIGVTAEDIYIRGKSWRFTYSYRTEDHLAIVSTARMDANFWRPPAHKLPANPPQIISSAEQMVTKDIAVLYWKLPQNADPKSVLVLFFSPDGRADDIWESDLHPENTIYGLRSSCPTLAAAYSRKTGVMRYLHPSILDCYDDPPTPDEEIYLLNLRGGWISANATDFLMPAFPIQMQREYYSWNPKGNAGFGPGVQSTYNRYVYSDGIGSISWLEISGAEPTYHMDRTTPGNGFDPKFVFEGRHEGSPYFQSRMTWDSGRLKHQLVNGDREWFMPCESQNQICYLDEFQSRQGDKLQLKRDGRRNLQLVQFGKDSIEFTSDEHDRITTAKGSDGNWRHYSYDKQGCLSQVDRSEGDSVYYTYQNGCHLGEIAVEQKGSSRKPILKLQYENNMITVFGIPGQNSFKVKYHGDRQAVGAAEVITPDQQHFSMSLGEDQDYVIHRIGGGN